ncbi:MAG: phosphopantetheine-binding protein [Micromonosporaceae bacterium]
MTTNAEQSAAARRVADIWCDVLGEPDPGDKTFFELGGQSIAAVRITTRIQDELGIDIEIGELFEDPTLSSFTEHVVSKSNSLSV